MGFFLQMGDTVRVCCASLSMGFGWSLSFAQRINEHRMSKSKALADSVLINADSRVIVFDQRDNNSLYHFVYVDNLGVLALREKLVELAMTDLECVFTSGGFGLHERSVGMLEHATGTPRR